MRTCMYLSRSLSLSIYIYIYIYVYIHLFHIHIMFKHPLDFRQAMKCAVNAALPARSNTNTTHKQLQYTNKHDRRRSTNEYNAQCNTYTQTNTTGNEVRRQRGAARAPRPCRALPAPRNIVIYTCIDRERERDSYTYIYIYIYTCIYVYRYIYIYICIYIYI